MGNYQDYLFVINLSLAYGKIVYWEKNIFLLPYGQTGKSSIDGISRLMKEWIHDSSLKDIAFKAIMVITGLFLQKSSQKSKSKHHLKLLENPM